MMKKYILIISLIIFNSCISNLSDKELKETYRVSIDKNNWNKALKCVDEGLRRNPKDTLLYFSRALCLSKTNPLENNEKITNNLNIFLSNYETSSRGRLLKYINYYTNRHYNEAINEVEIIEKYFGISPQTLLLKANAHFLNKSYKKSAFNYEEVLSYPISKNKSKIIYYYKIYSKYFAGNKEGASWDTAFLENYGFKKDYDLMNLITNDILNIDNLNKIPFFVDIDQFAEEIRPKVGLNYNFLFNPIYENQLFKSKTYNITDLKFLDKNIKILNLSNSQFTEIPNEIKLFKKLKALKISRNKIKNFDALFNQLAELDSLEYLNLDYSNLKNFPKSISKLKNLKGLSIEASNIKELPKEIGTLFNLSYLSVSNNGKLKQLPKEIKYLKNLNVLDVSGSGMQNLREELSLCYLLISIKANSSKIKSVPNNIGKLKLLNNLNLANNKIKEIPKSIGNLHYLTVLSLGSNEIETLPLSIKNLNNLKVLSIEFNKFKNFPKNILALKNLETLWLHNSTIPTIPKEIGELKKLSFLLVDHEIISNTNINQIKNINPKLHINRDDTRKNVTGIKRKK